MPAQTTSTASRSSQGRSLPTLSLVLGTVPPALAVWIGATDPAWCSSPYVGCLAEMLLLGPAAWMVGLVIGAIGYFIGPRTVGRLVPVVLNALGVALCVGYLLMV
ncbi:hypothetical protein AACH06_29540 [Ideonella sp. DXS29W]|uniref:Uncharacterized protein n=1 Tax=Ideonella lacteola TaxID=2984193 RepID=A0ABU9C0T7_9BURK